MESHETLQGEATLRRKRLEVGMGLQRAKTTEDLSERLSRKNIRLLSLLSSLPFRPEIRYEVGPRWSSVSFKRRNSRRRYSGTSRSRRRFALHSAPSSRLSVPFWPDEVERKHCSVKVPGVLLPLELRRPFRQLEIGFPSRPGRVSAPG